MLANGSTLSMKSGSTWKVLTDLKTLPEVGQTPEWVENTGLSDTAKQYEKGIGDYGDLAFEFTKLGASYKTLRAAELAETVDSYKITYPNGLTVEFSGQVSTKLGGGGVNSPIAFTATMRLQGDIEDNSSTAISDTSTSTTTNPSTGG